MQLTGLNRSDSFLGGAEVMRPPQRRRRRTLSAERRSDRRKRRPARAVTASSTGSRSKCDAVRLQLAGSSAHSIHLPSSRLIVVKVTAEPYQPTGARCACSSCQLQGAGRRLSLPLRLKLKGPGSAEILSARRAWASPLSQGCDAPLPSEMSPKSVVESRGALGKSEAAELVPRWTPQR